MMVLRILVGAALLGWVASCAESRLAMCESGLVCPAGWQCAANEDICISGTCGNGVVDIGEVCDDGNQRSDDQCRADCLSTGECGNGILDEGEDCDCGNSTVTPGPQCQGRSNTAESGVCNTTCRLHCGDGLLNSEEVCDQNAFRDTCLDLGYDRGKLTCMPSCTVSEDGCGVIGWESKPAGNGDLYAVWGIDQTLAFAVGDPDYNDQSSLFWFDGTQWSPVDLTGVLADPDIALYDIWGVQAQSGHIVYAVGESGTILQLTVPPGGPGDAGAAAFAIELLNPCPPESLPRPSEPPPLSPNCTATFVGVWAGAPNDLWVVGASRSIFHFNDDLIWVNHSSDLDLTESLRPSATVHSVWRAANGTVYIAGSWIDGSGNHGQVLRSGDKFDDWDLVGGRYGDELTDLWVDEADNVYLAGAGGAVMRLGAGNIWEPFLPPGLTDVKITSLWGLPGGRMVAVGHLGTILFYDGQVWMTMDTEISLRLQGVWGTAPNTFIAVGSGGNALHYVGQSWTSIPPVPDNARLNAIWAADPHSIHAVGGFGRIFHSDGQSWTTENALTGRAHEIFGIWGRKSGELYVVSEQGVISHFEGPSWSWEIGYLAEVPEECGPGFSTILRSVWGADESGPEFVVGERTCEYPRDPKDPNAPSGLVTEGIILRYQESALPCLTGDGRCWTESDLGMSVPPLSAVWGIPGQCVIATGNERTILRYSYPENTFTPESLDGVRCDGEPLRDSLRFHSVWGTACDNFYIVGEEGVIVHYGNHGPSSEPTWHCEEVRPREPLWSIWGRAEDDIYVVARQKGVALHYDGESWNEIRTGTVQRLLSVWGASDPDSGIENVVIVGEDGTVLRLLSSY